MLLALGVSSFSLPPDNVTTLADPVVVETLVKAHKEMVANGAG